MREYLPLLAQLVLFWLVTTPILTLLHELGHGAVALFVTRGPVTVWLGANPTDWTLEIGRINVSLRLETVLLSFPTQDLDGDRDH